MVSVVGGFVNLAARPGVPWAIAIEFHAVGVVDEAVESIGDRGLAWTRPSRFIEAAKVKAASVAFSTAGPWHGRRHASTIRIDVRPILVNVA